MFTIAKQLVTEILKNSESFMLSIKLSQHISAECV